MILHKRTEPISPRSRYADDKSVLANHVLEAFHLMRGNFPENVILVDKSRQVMAVNKGAAAMGLIKPGMNRAKIGDCISRTRHQVKNLRAGF